jgi:HAMP domain-containing protein
VVTLVDDGGAVLARSGEPGVPIGRQIIDPAAIRRLRAQASGFTADSLDARLGTQVAAHRVAMAPWVLFVGAAVEGSALTPEREWRVLILFGALGLGGALFLAGLVASRIADPLRKLTADAARLGAGDLAVRTDVQAPGEVGTLAATFNQMAGTLQARTAALARSEERHRLAARDERGGMERRRGQRVPNRVLGARRDHRVVVRAIAPRGPRPDRRESHGRPGLGHADLDGRVSLQVWRW